MKRHRFLPIALSVVLVGGGCAPLLGLDGDFFGPGDAAIADASPPPDVWLPVAPDAASCDRATYPCGRRVLPSICGDQAVGTLCEPGEACAPLDPDGSAREGALCVVCTGALGLLPCGMALPPTCGDNPAFVGQKCDEGKVCRGNGVPTCACKAASDVPCGQSEACDGARVTGNSCAPGLVCEFNVCKSCDPAATACGTKTSFACAGGAKDGVACTNGTTCCPSGVKKGTCASLALCN